MLNLIWTELLALNEILEISGIVENPEVPHVLNMFEHV